MPSDNDGQFKHVRQLEYETSRELRMRDLTPLQKRLRRQQEAARREAEDWIKRVRQRTG